MWEFPKTRGTLFGVLIIRILLFRVLYEGPLFSETPIFASGDPEAPTLRRQAPPPRAWQSPEL